MKNQEAPKSKPRKKTSSGCPSIRDIALQLGVSKSAVSLALNKPEKECLLAPATRERIIREARRMGYRTNTIAQTLRTGRFNAISLIVGDEPFYLPAEIAYGAEQCLEKNGCHLILSWLDERRLTSSDYVPKILDEWACDGLLLHPPRRFPQRIQEVIERFKVPSIWLNNKLDHDCVHFDDFAAARDVTTRLIGLGHRDIVYVHLYDFEHYSEADRLAGYECAMRAARLKPRPYLVRSEIALRDIRIDNRHELADAILALKPRPTAILCYEMAEAGPIFTSALRQGIRVPGQLSLVTFGGAKRNDSGFSISTINLQLEELGRRGAEQVLRKITHPRKALPPVVIPLRWGEGEVTMAPPSRRA